MKKLVLLLAVGSLLNYAAFAQKKDDKKSTETPSIGVGVDVAFPMGDLADVSKFGIGGTVKIAFPAGPGAVTVTTGYINFSGKDVTVGNLTMTTSSTYLIPFKAGYRLNLGQGFNIEPQLGYSAGKNSSGGFTYAAGLGYIINDQVDLSARYEGVSKSGSTLSFIGLRVAYNFSLGGK